MEHTIALIERAHNGDKEARDMLVEENMGLVWSIVKRFNGRGHEIEDLFQIGSIGLIKAIDKFDTSFEVKFSTYAVPMITGEIKRFIRDDGIIKISRSIKENSWKIKCAAEKFINTHGREATVNELALEVGITIEEIAMAMDINMEVESIYKTIYQGEGNEIYLVDKVADTDKPEIGQAVVNKILLTQLMNELSDVERELIALRYFKNKTQTQVAEVLGISQVQVSRLERKILLAMREKLEK